MGIVPEIIDTAVRAYCRRDPKAQNAFKGKGGKQRTVAPRPVLFIAFDTEAAADKTRTVPGFDHPRWGWQTQNLLFGAARIGKTAGMVATDEILFYPDDLPEYGLAALRTYVAANTIAGTDRRIKSGEGGDRLYTVALPERRLAPKPELLWRDEPDVTVHLMPLSEFLKEFYRITYQKQALVIGFNLPFDVSRLAFKWQEARSRRDAGAWSLSLWSYIDEKTGKRKPNPFRPNIIIKKSGPRRSFIHFTKPRGSDPWKGAFLDLGTLAFSLTNNTYSLAGAVKNFCNRELDKNIEHGIITSEYIAYGRNDVKATVDLARELLVLFDRFPVSRAAGGTLSETQTYSPASLAKAFLAAAGFKAPEVPEEMKGPCFAAFHGGWTEVHLRGTAPVVLLDFRKMYQTQFVLQRIQELLAAKRLAFKDVTAETIAFVETVTLADMFTIPIWAKLNVLCWVVSAGEVLITKARFDDKIFSTGMVPRNTGGKLIPVYLADVILAKLAFGRAPRIVKAERIIGEGRRELRRVPLPGGAVFDPKRHDFFKLNVEEGARLKKGIDHYAALPKAVRDALVPGIKCIGNSGAFGIFAETNAQDLPGDETEWVDLVGDGDRVRAKLRHPEKPGDFFCPPLAGLITAGARLMLGLAHHLVADKGGTVAFGDTDSLAVIATRVGRNVDIETTVDDGHRRRMIPAKSLSRLEIEEIAAEFEKLNPFDKDLIGTSLLEIKNPISGRDGDRMIDEITALCISSKRYCLYDCEGNLVDWKESMLGMLLSPLDTAPGDDRRDASKDWFKQAWQVIEANFHHSNAGHRDWLSRPRVRRLAASTPATMKHLKTFNAGKPQEEQIHPFNFFITTTAIVRDENGKPVQQSVVAPFERDPEKWNRLNWVFTLTGEPLIQDAPEFIGFVTVGKFLARYADHISPEWLDSSGRPCNGGTVGILTRRPIRDGERYLLTKESLTWGDDPQHAFERDRGGEFRGSDNSGSAVWRNWENAVRPAMKALGRKAVADALRISPDTVKAWIDGRWAADDIAWVSRAVFYLAGSQGLFTESQLETHGITTILSLVPERIALARFFNVFATAMITANIGGIRSTAGKIRIGKNVINRWCSPKNAPHTLADINSHLAILGRFARAELRKARLLRGPLREACQPRRSAAGNMMESRIGDRIALFAYLSVLQGSEQPAVSTQEEIFPAVVLIAACMAGALLLAIVVNAFGKFSGSDYISSGCSPISRFSRGAVRNAAPTSTSGISGRFPERSSAIVNICMRGCLPQSVS